MDVLSAIKKTFENAEDIELIDCDEYLIRLCETATDCVDVDDPGKTCEIECNVEIVVKNNWEYQISTNMQANSQTLTNRHGNGLESLIKDLSNTRQISENQVSEWRMPKMLKDVLVQCSQE